MITKDEAKEKLAKCPISYAAFECACDVIDEVYRSRGTCETCRWLYSPGYHLLSCRILDVNIINTDYFCGDYERRNDENV